ncbi:Acetylornithine deacetylase [Lacunisphaera limnophila]|uniref:Probable succinyl-diaminopimelate desuccinylase n=1 Tax=Lacunisphaera limnophila TaxID=1838286 RepID=A0A1D8AT43_9BACT|nr:ArgE/DapE family deacylase [Lacunisphaera limnophila]AOS44016.1 Acetylornithine deacetylase [Lacunisphaera limnophila]
MTPADYLASHSSDLVRLLQQLVRLRTVNPPGENYGEITTLLATTLRDLGLQVRRVPVPRALQKRTQPDLLDHPRYNVIAFWDAGAKKTVHFNAHFDVVPVSGEWKHGSPFSGTVDRGWIYGRGTSDMKGAIASIIFALKALRATGAKPNFNIEVSFTADEETDSTLGTGWVTAHGRLKADYAIVGEGGEGDGVCCGHNGVVWLNVRVHGRAAHGSTPEQGVNALEKMSALVLALDEYKRILAKKTFRTPDGQLRTPTLNIGGVFAPGEGGKINTVPAAASFSIDRRILPVETVAVAERDLRAFLKKAAARIPDCRITIEKVSDNHSCFRDPATPFADALRASVARVRRRPAHFCVSTGFNDMHFFANVLRLPTLGYGPGGQNYHAVDERAKVQDLVEAATIYTDLLTTFAG